MEKEMTPLDLDKLIHERVRLGIMAALSASEVMTFTELRETLKVTDGNLSVHIKILEENEYIGVEKRFVNKKPCTSYYLTGKGKEAFKKYINFLEKLIKNVRLE